jgi:type I restriction-modification system, S subunit
MAEAMKNSKTRWLGQIPADWDMVRVKDCFDRKNKKANQKDPIVLSLARSGVKIRDISSNEGQLAADYTNYNPVAKDDILINPMDLVSGDNCNISRVEGVISPAYVNLRYKKGINPRFYNYYFKLQYWLGAFFAHGFGVSFDNRWTLSYETLSKYPLVLPPSDEQIKIADFLDEKCAEIDKLSEDIQKQIDILNDYKKSVITRAVTKGLDPNAEMKDSGIKWIGEIPKDWTCKKIKYLANTKQSNSFVDGDWIEAPFVKDNGIRYITTGNIGDGVFKRQGDGYVTEEDFKMLKCKYAYSGDLIFSRLNEEYGRSCILPNDYPKYVIAVDNVILRTEHDKRFICYCTQCPGYHDSVADYARGTAMKRISRINLGNISIPIPTLSEEVEIADYLDDKCSKINDSISAKQEQIAKLDTYKKSMIYEYVTGKKRMKGLL